MTQSKVGVHVRECPPHYQRQPYRLFPWNLLQTQQICSLCPHSFSILVHQPRSVVSLAILATPSCSKASFCTLADQFLIKTLCKTVPKGSLHDLLNSFHVLRITILSILPRKNAQVVCSLAPLTAPRFSLLGSHSLEVWTTRRS